MTDKTQPEYREERVGTLAIAYGTDDRDRVLAGAVVLALADDRTLKVGKVELPWAVIEKLQERNGLRHSARIDEESNP